MSIETWDYHDQREYEAQMAAERPPLPRLGTFNDVAQLERIRNAAWAYVNAPQKFGIRHSAYRSLVEALENEREGRQE
jgi:hypothetical protein